MRLDIVMMGIGMNERIKQLAAQAERQVYPVTSLYNEDSAPRLNSEFEKKFAELIVRECIGIVQPYISRWPEDCELVIKIKEHFGVKE